MRRFGLFPLRVRVPTGEKTLAKVRCGNRRGNSCGPTRAYLIYPFPDGPPEVPPYHFFCVLELKKLGKTFGAKKIMSTFAPVSEILLLTDTERAHMSGGIREIWANTRVAKWGRL